MDKVRVLQARGGNKSNHTKVAVRRRFLGHTDMVEILIVQSSLRDIDAKVYRAICVGCDLKGLASIFVSSHSLRFFDVSALSRSSEQVQHVTVPARLKMSLLSARGLRDVSLSSCLSTCQSSVFSYPRASDSR